MPSYEYTCSECGISYEVKASIHEESDKPICCGKTMLRVFSTAGIHFKGGGWGGK